MSRLCTLSLLFALVACATAEPTPPDQRSRYLGGHAAPGSVTPAEFTYENRDASLEFPPKAAAPTLRQIDAEALDGGSDWPEESAAGMSEDLYGGGYGGSGDDYWESDYGGAGRLPGHGRPRPPVVRPPPRPRPPIAKPDPEERPEKKPRPGSADRRSAKSAPEKPERSRDATKSPTGGRSK